MSKLSPREVLEKYMVRAMNMGTVYDKELNQALSDLAEIVLGICAEESSKWVGINPDKKFAGGVKAGIEAIKFRLTKLFEKKTSGIAHPMGNLDEYKDNL